MQHTFIRLHRFLIGVFILTSCAGPPSEFTPVGTQVITANALMQPLQSFGYHTISHEVGPMETLWRIAKEYDVDIHTIMRANNIRNAKKIQVGQMLTIPGTRGLRPVIPLYQKRPWSYIVIHHTATEIGNAAAIDRSHQKRGFWDGLGYHFLIDNGTLGKLDGQIEISPRWIKQKDGAHCNVEGMNQKGIGIALVGNFSQTRVSKRQLEALEFLVSTLMVHYQIPIDHVVRHSDVPGKNTECPGNYFPWDVLIRDLGKRVR